MDGLWKRTLKGANEERKADEIIKNVGAPFALYKRVCLISLATFAYDEGDYEFLGIFKNWFLNWIQMWMTMLVIGEGATL